MEKSKNNILDQWRFVIIACLTLGLAPFYPEPHIWGKIRWITGGAVGMGFIDWFDVVLHGLPWVLLLRLAGKSMYKTILSGRKMN